MIVYRKGISLRVLLRISGSVMPSAAIAALLSAMMTLLFQFCVPREYLSAIFDHPFPFQPIASTVAFALVFRTNVAYNRYWESCTQVAAMSAKWGDVVADATSFDELEKPTGNAAAESKPEALGGPQLSAEEVQRRSHKEKRHSQARILHMASLEHALALQYLRRDDDLLRLQTAEVPLLGVEGCLSPAVGDGAQLRGMMDPARQLQYEKTHEDAKLQSFRSEPPHAGEGAQQGLERSGSHSSPHWRSSNGVASVEAPAEATELPIAPADDGSGATHLRHSQESQQRPRTLKRQQSDASDIFRTQIRNERLLEEQRGFDHTGIAWPELPVLGGVTDAERLQLMRCEDRVALAHSRLLHQLNMRRKAGGLWCDPPTFSRVFQGMSDGMLAFRQARKIEDVPFPWPYAQMVSFLLFSFGLVFPLLVASQMGNKHGTEAAAFFWLPPMLTFLTVLAHTGLYKTARTLEDPFVHPPNDLPGVAMQESHLPVALAPLLRKAAQPRGERSLQPPPLPKAFNARLLSHWDALRAEDDDEAPRVASTVALGEHARKQAVVPQLEDFHHLDNAINYYQVKQIDEAAQLLWKQWDERHLSTLYDDVVFLKPPAVPAQHIVQSGFRAKRAAAQAQESWSEWFKEGVRDINDNFKDWSVGLRRRRQPSWLEV